MFRKFSRAENIKTQSKVKSSEQRGIRAAILDQYPALEPHIEDLLPKKGDTIVCKCKDYIQLILDPEGEFMFFQCRNGPFIPTLRLLHKFPDILPKFTVDRGAIRFVLSGANIMAPGLTSAGGKMDDVPEGTTVGIFAEGTRRAVERQRRAEAEEGRGRRAEAGGPRWPLWSGGGRWPLCGLSNIHAAWGCGAAWPRLAAALCSLWHELALRAAPTHAGKEHALAIGVTLASTAQIRAENKGNAVENTLWLNDGLWVMRTGAM